MIVYITGSSKGIGKALTLKLLKLGHFVYGISRTNKIFHQNFKHVSLDLSDIKAVKSFEFETNFKDDIVLINNAGVILPIKPIGHLLDDEIINITNVNLLSPQILINKFIHKFQTFENKYHIINISSGAGKYPIDAWATYCASKSGIDLFSETIKLEFTNRSFDNWNIHSFAPGVVDTEMQEEIRNANPKDFNNLQKFISLKENKELLSPTLVADKIIEIIEQPKKYKNVVFSIRDNQ